MKNIEINRLHVTRIAGYTMISADCANENDNNKYSQIQLIA